MTRGAEGGGESAGGANDNSSRGGSDRSEGGRSNRSDNNDNGENREGGSTNGESGGEGGGEGGLEGGGGNPRPRDCDPVRDETIPRPPRNDSDRDRRRDNDYYWPIPEINTPTVRISASGGYGTEVRPSGPSRVVESTVGVSGGGTLLPALEIGNFNK